MLDRLLRVTKWGARGNSTASATRERQRHLCVQQLRRDEPHPARAARGRPGVRALQGESVPWTLLSGGVHFDNQLEWDGLQAADMYAGMLQSACRCDEFDNYEEHHLLAVRHQVHRNPQGSAWGWGFKVLGNNTTIQSLPWWPPEGI